MNPSNREILVHKPLLPGMCPLGFHLLTWSCSESAPIDAVRVLFMFAAQLGFRLYECNAQDAMFALCPDSEGFVPIHSGYPPPRARVAEPHSEAPERGNPNFRKKMCVDLALND